jgi:hypothetical protein
MKGLDSRGLGYFTSQAPRKSILAPAYKVDPFVLTIQGIFPIIEKQVFRRFVRSLTCADIIPP